MPTQPSSSCTKCCAKKLLQNDSKASAEKLLDYWSFFSAPSSVQERKLRDYEKVLDVIENTGTDGKITFKKSLFWKMSEKAEMENDAIKHLVYIQATEMVESDLFPCKEAQALELAALQMLASYGPYNPDKHVEGFLANSNAIVKLMPQRLLPTKSPFDWEKRILKLHSDLGTISEDQAKSDYLKIVQNWPFYGTYYFPDCKCSNKKLPGRITVGVNEEGIVIFDRSGDLLSAFPFSDIISWRSSVASFEFECGSEEESYQFDTLQGETVSMMIQDYVDKKIELLLEEENGDTKTCK